MPCYRPLEGWQSRQPSARGGNGFSLKRPAGQAFLMTVPCGQCIGCRKDKARAWAVRCMHEAQLHEENSFITLTYSPENLPDDRSLNKKHFQDFMKRLRKRYEKDESKVIRYFHCGEYGEQLHRPHYHALVFGHEFSEGRRDLSRGAGGKRLYTSSELSELWEYGYHSIGAVTFESAAYVAQYAMKKIGGDLAEEHYKVAHPDTGELLSVDPEYGTMSRRPGIGAEWIKRHYREVYPADEVVVSGRTCPPPRYYDKWLFENHPDLYEEVKRKRIQDFEKRADDCTIDRLAVREFICQKNRSKLSRRALEES